MSLRRVSTPAFVPADFMASDGEGRTISKYRKNQKIFSQGESADSVFSLQKGRVKLTVISDHGKEAVMAILSQGEIFGEGCLSHQPRRIATARAMTECEVTRIDRDVLVRALNKEPSLSAMILEHVLRRTIRVEADLVDQLFNSSEKRLARALLMLADFEKEGKQEQTIPKISQKTLAEMIGTTRSRVSSFMTKFQKMGFVRYDGSMMAIHGSLVSVLLKNIPHRIKSDIGTSNDSDLNGWPHAAAKAH